MHALPRRVCPGRIAPLDRLSVVRGLRGLVGPVFPQHAVDGQDLLGLLEEVGVGGDIRGREGYGVAIYVRGCGVGDCHLES